MSTDQVEPSILEGVVVSSADKTIGVKITSQKPHKLYRKIVLQSSKVLAHDEENTCQIGDTVVIQETRPVSKRKSWALVTVKRRAE